VIAEYFDVDLSREEAVERVGCATVDTPSANVRSSRTTSGGA
jgi:hypothetical protein